MVRKIFSARHDGNIQIGMAEASLDATCEALLHFHKATTEIYFVLRGTGYAKVGDDERQVCEGDAVMIEPGQVHRMKAGTAGITFLCCTSPPFQFSDCFDEDGQLMKEPS